MYLILIILVVIFIFYVSDKTTSQTDRELWHDGEKLTIKISALAPVFLGCVWFLTFGFTDYREHLAFIGFPLSLFSLTYGFRLARLTYSVILLSCVLAFAASLFFIFVAVSTLILRSLIPAIAGFIYVIILRDGLYRRFQNNLS